MNNVEFSMNETKAHLFTGVCSYVQKHVIDALEGFSQFLANEHVFGHNYKHL